MHVFVASLLCRFCAVLVTRRFAVQCTKCSLGQHDCTRRGSLAVVSPAPAMCVESVTAGWCQGSGMEGFGYGAPVQGMGTKDITYY